MLEPRRRRQGRGRSLSAAIHARTETDGILHPSRLTGAVCRAVYERAVGKLSASPIEDLVTMRSLVPTLRSLGVTVIP